LIRARPESAYFLMDRNVTLASPGSILKLTHELSAGRVNIVTTGGAYRCNVAGLIQDVLKPLDGVTAWTTVTTLREWIERNQVDLAG
jgi:hypothetical protein